VKKVYLLLDLLVVEFKIKSAILKADLILI